MPRRLDLAALLSGCADESFDDGVRIDNDLEPLFGPGSAVKPAVCEGGIYQFDRRWETPDDGEPTHVIVIDNVPSQANRLEEALVQTILGAPWCPRRMAKREIPAPGFGGPHQSYRSGGALVPQPVVSVFVSEHLVYCSRHSVR